MFFPPRRRLEVFPPLKVQHSVKRSAFPIDFAHQCYVPISIEKIVCVFFFFVCVSVCVFFFKFIVNSQSHYFSVIQHVFFICFIFYICTDAQPRCVEMRRIFKCDIAKSACVRQNASWLHPLLLVLRGCGDFYGLGPMCFCLTAVRVDESAQFKQPLIIDVSVMGGLPGDGEKGVLQSTFMIPVCLNKRPPVARIRKLLSFKLPFKQVFANLR